jgi:glycosyltransferase involved in cell wall biosynthesis
MAKVSVIIPARNERFLVPTIEDVFKNARGEVEVIAVLEGYTPDNWKETVAKYPALHTIQHHEAKGMRAAINAGAASAISRGAKYLAKFDAHCCFGEGFDEIIKADMDKDWIVVPRRKRLDPDTFAPRNDGRLDIDYHYLTFPDNVKDFGGPGLNGRVWDERARERLDILLDEEMSSQGSGWAMHAAYFTELELMDAANYGQFWNEFQELGLKCWLSGGQVMVNKKTFYAHWHKGSAGRGYHLPKEWLAQGATFTKRWLFNEAWAKQTLPFKTLIERFWPVPTWPENWEELVYGGRKSVVAMSSESGVRTQVAEVVTHEAQLVIHSAHYGIDSPDRTSDVIDVTNVLQQSVVGGSLDIVVTNDSLKVGNPFRGQKKQLTVVYSYDDGEPVTITRDERDWLIIGQSARYVKQAQSTSEPSIIGILDADGKNVGKVVHGTLIISEPPRTAAALNDALIRRFRIHDRRLRGPMPIEVPSFHRDDLAKLFAELGFLHGAEIGVAEGNYSEVLLKANPDCHLLLVDPWHAYSNNPQNKSKEKNEYAYNETVRKTKDYPNVTLDMRYSMDAVRDVPDNSLDFVYIDAHHSYPFVMEDIIAWSRKVRSGGIVSGDDVYQLNEKWGAGPMEAVYHYTEAMKINPWFLIDAHKSVDFFWVKP